MTFIQPFRGLRPLPDFAQKVASPPYDVLSSEEARELAQGKPHSFLHIAKPEIDLDPSVDLYDESVYQKGKANLAAMIQQGILIQEDRPCYYLYQMQEGDHIQNGLVAVASAEKYDQNLICKHELTREDKEQDRIRMIDTLNCQASPVLLTCKPNQRFEAFLAEHTKTPPIYEVTNELGVIHRLWILNQSTQIEELNSMFNGPTAIFDRIYIADGHHRSASGAKIAQRRKEANPQHTGLEPYNFFLSVIYPANQMKIMDYNRVVKDLQGKSADSLLDEIKKHYSVHPEAGPYKPQKPGEIGMYLKNKWYKLAIHPDQIPQDPTEALDVSTLYNYVLAPLLGVGNPRKDKRIDFVGGIRGLKELVKLVDSGEWAVAFAMYPTQMEQIMNVADAGQIMPPKSTWFEPKLVDGLISHLL